MNTSNTTVADIRKVLEKAYPPYLAEKWDAVGLICGDPTAEYARWPSRWTAPKRWQNVPWKSVRTCWSSTIRC